MELDAQIEPAVEVEKPDDNKSRRPSIGKLREWFVSAVDNAQEWREAAREDYEFVSGKQWSDEDIETFKRQGRPAIIINRIKPLINVLSGYQRLNRYDIDFLARTGDDEEICKVRKGITKYILDRCDYDTNESQVFMDAAISGIGWFEVGYKFDMEIGDGEAYVIRQDPFGIYVDPESHKADYSDAKYIFRAKWTDKDSLVDTYPEYKEDIIAQCEVYDKAEKVETEGLEFLWSRKDLKKIRLVECWYKIKEKVTQYFLQDGTSVPQKDVTIDMFLNGLIVGQKTITVQKVRVAVFFDRILLEDIESPYEHREFPFVPLVCTHYGVGDIPAGFVRDLKDPQREINRRRIQTLHILNTAGNGGGFFESNAMTPEQLDKMRRNGNKPGTYIEVQPGAISGNKIRERQLQAPPTGVIQAEAQCTADLTAISGINESLMGTEVASSVSGRAIELKQKQAITHIAPMFDNLRKAKKVIATLLWGVRGHKGIVPQYYTDEKVYRVEGENGQQYITVNQQVIEQDPLGNVIHQTLNNLSEGDFDIIIADTQASTTQRQAQMYSLVDAVSKLGIPADLVFDTIIDLSDLPNRNDIKQRWTQRQQAQSQQAQQQMELEMVKNQNLNQTISFKDAPLPIQFAMAAKQGLIDPQVAQYATNMMIEQMFPMLARRMAQTQQMQLQAQQIQQMQQQAQQMQNGKDPRQPQAVQNKVDTSVNLPSVRDWKPQQQKATTQATAESIMRGMTPAM